MPAGQRTGRAVFEERTRRIAWGDESTQNAIRYSFLLGRSLGYDWHSGSAWQERSAKLFAAAAEVAKALGRQWPAAVVRRMMVASDDLMLRGLCYNPEETAPSFLLSGCTAKPEGRSGL